MQEKQILSRISKAEKRIVDLYRKLLSSGVGGFQTLANVLVTGQRTGGKNIIVDNADAIELENTSLLRKGTYNYGSNGGISRICSNNYEDMWQNGFRHVFDQSGFIRQSTNCFSEIPSPNFDETLRFKVGSFWTLDNGTTYICTDNTEGAAVWELYSSPTSKYKAFTALLTQSGESNYVDATSGPLIAGFSYNIDIYNAGDDFSNVGGPAAGLQGEWDGYSFLATGVTPTNWNNSSLLIYNEGAPVATVLENTIGDIWFTYFNVGSYGLYSNGLFVNSKTFSPNTGTVNYSAITEQYALECIYQSNDWVSIATFETLTGSGLNDSLNYKFIEIRVYN